MIRINGAFALFLFVDAGDAAPNHLAGRPVVLADRLDRARSAEERTRALQEVIDAAARHDGGAIVRLPEGHFTVGTIEMRSGVHLHVPEGCVLQGASDRRLYPVDPPPTGLSIGRCRLIHFFEVEDSGIFGRGVIDGNGFHLRHAALLAEKRVGRVTSNLVRINRCANIHIEDILLRDSEFWNTHILDSERVRLQNIKIINEIPPPNWDPHNPDFFWNNADGINPDATIDLQVDGLFAYCGDDCIPVKNTGNARDAGRETKALRFRRCTLISETTVTKIGTETCGSALRDILFEDILILDGGSPFGLILRDGADVSDITLRGLHACRMSGPIYLQTSPRRPSQQHAAGTIRCLRFENCRIEHTPGFAQSPIEVALVNPWDLTDVFMHDLVIDGETIDESALSVPPLHSIAGTAK